MSLLSPKPRHRGFTLIELLVVIAIIAILQYVQDNDETMPYDRSEDEGNIPWHANIYSYVKSTGIYKCPSNSGANTGNINSSTTLGGPAIPFSNVSTAGDIESSESANWGGSRPLRFSAHTDRRRRSARTWAAPARPGSTCGT